MIRTPPALVSAARASLIGVAASSTGSPGSVPVGYLVLESKETSLGRMGDLAQNVNFAWRIGLLKTLMDQKGIAYEPAGKSAARSGIDLAGLLQKATVKIACWR